MRVDSAVTLVNSLVLKPGWKVEAEDYSHRHEGCIRVNFTYVAYRSERELAPDGYPELVPGGARAAFVIAAGAMKDDYDLYRKVIELIVFEIELHEWREFLRVPGTFWAPFHPHRTDGMERWGTPEKDMTWGVA